MTDEAYMVIKIILGIFGIIGGGYALFKLIRAQAATEADLRNEIRNLQTDTKQNCDEIEKILRMTDQQKDKSDNRFDIVSQRLGEITVLEKRMNSQETMNEKIDRKMDMFVSALNDIKILLERKLDRP